MIKNLNILAATVRSFKMLIDYTFFLSDTPPSPLSPHPFPKRKRRRKNCFKILSKYIEHADFHFYLIWIKISPLGIWSNIFTVINIKAEGWKKWLRFTPREIQEGFSITATAATTSRLYNHTEVYSSRNSRQSWITRAATTSMLYNYIKIRKPRARWIPTLTDEQ